MSTPIPVPSKAAIRALRGLALGTSCALGLIVEDRRRRISTLRTAIDNKKKLRTSRKYHRTTDAVHYVGEDPVVLSGDELHWHCQDNNFRTSLHERSLNEWPPSHDKAPVPDARHTTDKVATSDQYAATPIAIHTSNPPLRHIEKAERRIPGFAPVLELPRAKDSGGWARAPAIRPRARPDQKIAELSELPISNILQSLKQPGSLATYKAAFIAGCQMSAAFKKKLDHNWLKVSEALCAHCRAEGLWSDAQDILAAVVKYGEIDETQFYAHEPRPIIDSLLLNLEVDGDSRAKRLNLAVQLFLAKFEFKPTLHADDVLSQGRTLLASLFQYNQIHLVHLVYRRVLGQQEHPEQFTAWFIRALFDFEDYKSVVNYFKVNFSKMSPNVACFNATVQLVLQSVEEMRGAQTQQVARALATQCKATGLQPQVGWIIRLLQSHWGRNKDLQMSRDLFDEISSLGMMEMVGEPGEVHQIMVKLSVLAADNEAAQYYYQETILLTPQLANDVWLNGYIALMKAKSGDWDGVFDDFSRLKQRRRQQQKAYDQTFVAVLKVFTEGHAVAQVEDFVRLYMREMGVRLHRYIVTLVANQYGGSHDHEGFLRWLQYCAASGFALDAAFSNAILRNMRLKWKFPYYELRKMHSEIQKISPAAVDDVTARIMHSAAMEEGNYSGTKVQHRLHLAGTLPSKLPYHFRSANERDVLHAMTEELVRGNPAKTVVIYKRALRFGMPWCPKCFRVAIKASLQRAGDNLDTTIKLISETHAMGHDITPGVTVFLKAQIIHFRGSFEDVMATLQTTTARFESIGISIDPSILTQTAIMSAQFGHFGQAVDLCKLAMIKSGATNPCYSRQCFRALLMAYWQTMDTVGLRWVVESLPSSSLAADKTAHQLLKSTRRHMSKWRKSARVDEMYEILQSGLDQATQQRETQIKVGSRMYSETLRIISDAAGTTDSEQGGIRNGKTLSGQPPRTLTGDMRVQMPLEAYG